MEAGNGFFQHLRLLALVQHFLQQPEVVPFAARVVGVNVCDDEHYFRALIHRIANEAIERFSLPVTLEPAEIGILDGYVGRGYGINRPEELALLVETARREGIVLDPVYGAKAWFALREEITRGHRFAGASDVLFVHTGGVFGLFPKADELVL